MLKQIDDVVHRIRMEYAEMPGLSLTFWQAQRLWDLSDEICEQALELVTRSGFLVRNREGAYVRPNWMPSVGSQRIEST